MGTFDYLLLIVTGVVAAGVTVVTAIVLARAGQRWAKALLPVPFGAAFWYLLLPTMLAFPSERAGTVGAAAQVGILVGTLAIIALVVMLVRARRGSGIRRQKGEMVKEIVCPRCGQGNPPNTRHCTVCGATLIFDI